MALPPSPGADAAPEPHVPASKSYPLTDKCHHYTHISEVPWDIQRYWHQRRSIFSLYDEGVQMTDDAWFGVTPEPVAYAVAADLARLLPSSPETMTLIDLFGGAGGNSIAFAGAGHWAQVVSLELDASTIAYAQRNAEIYEVSEWITWVNADCFEFLARVKKRWAVAAAASKAALGESNGAREGERTGEVEMRDVRGDKDDIDLLLDQLNLQPERTVIFASPPWGGPGYRGDAVFDLSTMQPYSLRQIYNACCYDGGRLPCALYLPRTSDLRQIAKLENGTDPSKKIEVIHYCMEGASKALVAYIEGEP